MTGCNLVTSKSTLLHTTERFLPFISNSFFYRLSSFAKLVPESLERGAVHPTRLGRGLPAAAAAAALLLTSSSASSSFLFLAAPTAAAAAAAEDAVVQDVNPGLWRLQIGRWVGGGRGGYGGREAATTRIRFVVVSSGSKADQIVNNPTIVNNGHNNV